MLARTRQILRQVLAHPRSPWIITGVGLGIRLVALALLSRTPLDGDARDYHLTALELAHAVPHRPEWPPGLPLYLSLAHRLFGDQEIVARAAMVPLYLGMCALVQALGRRLAGPVTASLALGIFALAPIFVWTSVTPLTQMLSATAALGAVYAVERSCEGAPRAAGLLGIALAMLLLTRPSNLLLVLALLLYLAWRRRRWQALAIPVVVMTLGVGAWTLRAREMTGRVVFINDANAQNLFYGNNPWTPSYRTWWFGSHKSAAEVPAGYAVALARIHQRPVGERDQLYTLQAIQHIRERPDLFVVRTAARIRTFLAFDTFTCAQLTQGHRGLAAAALALDAICFVALSILAILFPVAARAGLPAERRPLVGLLLLASVAYALPYFIAFSHPTLHFTAVPLLGLLGAATGERLLEGGGPAWEALSLRHRRMLGAALVVFLAIQIEWTIDVFGRLR